MSNGTATAFTSGGALLITMIIGLGSLILVIIMWWNIFSKAGFSGARSLLLFIPIVNLIILLMFAFGEWPIHRELNQLRMMAGRGGGFPPPQYPGPGGGYGQPPQYPGPGYGQPPQYPQQ